MDNKQLYEKQANSYNPIFPLVRLEDIIETISDKSIQWILNNYNHIYVEYSESREVTRNKVPQMLRRSGLWISYNNGKKNITEYYIGENTNINNYVEWTLDDNWKEFDELTIQDKSITYQHLSDALKQLFAGGNTITNFPDEEDITSDGTVLSFKDRKYDSHTFSGLGKVILRKNLKIVDKQYKNILTQEMINKENTIYEIRYDFDLNGDEITIPENCVLDFQGGSFSNGTIIGSNTSIKAELIKIFSLDIEISGNWNIVEAYPEWFGAKSNNDVFYATINRKSINKCIQLFDVLTFQPYEYIIDCDENGIAINLNKQVLINGQKGTIIVFGATEKSKIFNVTARYCTIEDLYIKGYNDSDRLGYCIYCNATPRLVVNRCRLQSFEYGIYSEGWTQYFNNIEVTFCKYGIYINEPNSGGLRTATNILNCYCRIIDECGYYLRGLSYSVISNCAADDCKIAYTLTSCKSINIQASGTEKSARYIYIFDSENITIENGYITLSPSVYIGTEDDYKYMIHIGTKNKNILFSNCRFKVNGALFTPERNKYIYIENDGNQRYLRTTFSHCYSETDILNAFTYAGSDEYYYNNVIVEKCSSIIGSFNYRPKNLDSHQVGYKYFDTDLKKWITWNGSTWIEFDGVPANTNRFGSTNYRPDLKTVPIGFMYFDTSINRPIFKAEDKWVDATGADI